MTHYLANIFKRNLLTMQKKRKNTKHAPVATKRLMEGSRIQAKALKSVG